MASVGEIMAFWRYLSIVDMLILILIIIFSIFGNAIVLFTTWKERNLHQPNKYFIACLAVADLLIGMIVVPIMLYQRRNGISSIHLCRFFLWVDVFLQTASIYTLTFISFDRYLKISKPLQYKSKMTTSRSLKVIFSVWLIAAVFGTLSMFPYKEGSGIRVSDEDLCYNKNKIFYTFGAVCAFLLPAIFMLIMYLLIFLIVRKRRRMLQNGELGQTSNNSNERAEFLQDLKVIRMMVIVVGVFILSWAPFFIRMMLFYYNQTPVVFCNEHSCKSIFYLILILERLVAIFPYFNSTLNPIIYAFLDQTYRAAIKHLFKKIMCRHCSRRVEQ